MHFLKKILGIKETDDDSEESVYPGENIYFLRYGNEVEGKSTGWVNKVYVNYKQKSKTPYSCSILIDLSNAFTENNEDLDWFSIEMYIMEALRAHGVVHFIARRAKQHGMEVLLYLENNTQMQEQLKAMKNKPTCMFSFDYEIEYDEEWELAKQLFNA